jgi:hypothetical protein
LIAKKIAKHHSWHISAGSVPGRSFAADEPCSACFEGRVESHSLEGQYAAIEAANPAQWQI